MSDADSIATGLAEAAIDPLRYDAQPFIPGEAHDLICQAVPLRARVLDVGCGTGLLPALLQSHRHANVVGIEPSLERAELARQRGLQIVNDLLDERIAPTLGKFDVVVFADVLEHLADPHSVLSLAAGLLADKGIVVATIPNVAHWTVRFDLLFGKFDYEPYGIMDATHLRWFTRRSVRRLFESAGLEMEQYRVTPGTTLPAYFSRLPWRWMPGRIRRPLVRTLARWMPGLFGCQHVVVARRSQS